MLQVSEYVPCEKTLNLIGLEFPMKKDDISKFEILNPSLSIFVFALDKLKE